MMTAENKKRKESRFLHRLLVCLFLKMHHHMLRFIDEKKLIIGIAFVKNYGNKKGKKKYISLFKDIQLFVDKFRKGSKRNQRPNYRSQFRANVTRHKNICELKKNDDKKCIPVMFYQLKNVPDEVIRKAEKEARDILSGKLKQCDMGLDIDIFEPSPLDKEVEEIFEKETSIILNCSQEHNNSDASSDHNEVSDASSEGTYNMLNSIAYNTPILDTLDTFVSSEEKNKNTCNNCTCNIYLLVVVPERPINLAVVLPKTASVKDTSMQGINDTPVVRKLKRPADVTPESDQLSPAKRRVLSPQAGPSWCPDIVTAIQEVKAQEELKNSEGVSSLQTASVKYTSMQGINNSDDEVTATSESERIIEKHRENRRRIEEEEKRDEEEVMGQEEFKNSEGVSSLKTASVKYTSMQGINNRPVEVLQSSQDPFLSSTIGYSESYDEVIAHWEIERIIEKQREEQSRDEEEDVHASENLNDITGLKSDWIEEFTNIDDYKQKYGI